MNVLIHVPIPSDTKPVADFINNLTPHEVCISSDLSTITCSLVSGIQQTYTYKEEGYLTFYAGENKLSGSKLQHLCHIQLGNFYQSHIFELTQQEDYIWLVTYWHPNRKRELNTHGLIQVAYTEVMKRKDNFQLVEIKGILPQKDD